MGQKLACFTHFCYTWVERYERAINISEKTVPRLHG